MNLKIKCDFKKYFADNTLIKIKTVHLKSFIFILFRIYCKQKIIQILLFIYKRKKIMTHHIKFNIECRTENI